MIINNLLNVNSRYNCANGWYRFCKKLRNNLSELNKKICYSME